ncbi:MAG: XRE family transcriptional regulator [Lachnospiraceae bacterium]|nr:MAG: XRE family transcriptional regulator [Lachnospiraceae bacterium]
MKLDRVKIELLQAKSCMSTSELLQKAKISFPVLLNAGKKICRPTTAGKIAKALGVDVTEIIETK